MKYITTSQTPVYQAAANGFYRAVRSLPMGTPVAFIRTGTDANSNRPVGFFDNGEIMYLDSLALQLQEVTVKDTRLWDWLFWIGAGIGVTYLLTKK